MFLLKLLAKAVASVKSLNRNKNRKRNKGQLNY
jgi:hypothetical protein